LVNVLFVCLGNICRSPSAEGLFRALVVREELSGRIAVDSAGTGDWHIGKPPDRRAQAAARRRGVDISGLRARQAGPADFRRFDYVLAMDRDNHADLAGVCPPGEEHRLALLLDFAPEIDLDDVPDPYYGGAEDFEVMLDLIEFASTGLLSHIRQTHFRQAR
jgi:protein-tyrosine phosphatase